MEKIINTIKKMFSLFKFDFSLKLKEKDLYNNRTKEMLDIK